MISTADFRNGLVFVMDNNLMEIVEFQHVKPGKGGAFVRTRIRNILTGRMLDKTFRSGERMEEARVDRLPYQYMYTDGDLYHFMDNETYEQVAVNDAIVGDRKDWLKENIVVELWFYNGKVIALNVPNFVVMTVTQCDPGLQGDRSTGGTKPATMETGVVIQVPLFIGEGETLKIDTRTRAYIERVN